MLSFFPSKQIEFRYKSEQRVCTYLQISKLHKVSWRVLNHIRPINGITLNRLFLNIRHISIPRVTFFFTKFQPGFNPGYSIVVKVIEIGLAFKCLTIHYLL